VLLMCLDHTTKAPLTTCNEESDEYKAYFP
jgi:hypothetical protein